MDTWQIVLLVVVVLLVLALVGWLLSRGRGAARAKQEAQAREHLNEARIRQARADGARAAAEEQAAKLRRERAELEQRMAEEERESAKLAEDADREAAKAAELKERARKLAPGLVDADTTRRDATPAARRDTDGDGRPDAAPVGYADTSRFGSEPATSHAAPVYPPSAPYAATTEYPAADPVPTSHRGVAPRDADGDGRPDGGIRERLDRDRGDGDIDGDGRPDDRRVRADSDGDGRPDGGLRERLDADGNSRTGSVRADSDSDGRPDGSVAERLDGDDATRAKPSLKERLLGRTERDEVDRRVDERLDERGVAADDDTGRHRR